MIPYDFYEYLKSLPQGTYLVSIELKYSSESIYEKVTAICDYDPQLDSYVWDWDWDEGQEDVIFTGIISIDDIEVPDNLREL